MNTRVLAAVTAAVLVGLVLILPAFAQDKPRPGGELIFLVPSEPPSYDGHKEGRAPRWCPISRSRGRFRRTVSSTRCDCARACGFHDGSVMTSRDVKASYDKIVFPPPETSSYRKGQYRAVEAVEAPDPSTIRFRLKWPEASFLTTLASPYGWIYKADILAKDIRWYEENVMGTGPFVLGPKITVQESPWTARCWSP